MSQETTEIYYGTLKISFPTKNCAILGANGSGKSSLSREMYNNHKENSILITAKRNLTIKQGSKRAVDDDQLKYSIASFSTNDGGLINKRHWGGDLSGSGGYNNIEQTDFNDNIEKLHREFTNLHSHNSFNHRNNEDYVKPETRLEQVFGIWTNIFKKEIKPWEDGKIKIDGKYEIEGLSDGERSALYLIIKCLSEPEKSMIIVDEAETHLNSAILQDLWDAIEQARSDCKFVYISHNIEFISTRKDCTKFWIKDFTYPDTWDILPIEEDGALPEELILKIIGSKKTKILFVEGTQGSNEQKQYQQIYPEFKVQSVGSCENVINYTKSLNKNSNENYNKDFFGLIDRHFRSDGEIESLRSDKIFFLAVAAFEGLFFREEVVRFVLEYLGVSDIKDKITNLKSKILEHKANMKSDFYKHHIEYNFKQKLNGITYSKTFTYTDDLSEITMKWEELEKITEYNNSLQKLNSKSVKELGKITSNSWDGWSKQVLNIFNTEKAEEFRKEFIEFMPKIIINLKHTTPQLHHG